MVARAPPTPSGMAPRRRLHRDHRLAVGDLEAALLWMSAHRPYVGRFAPSPTGFMHLGIARTALVAWLDARTHEGRILLRMEDIDQPRVVTGSADGLRRDLEWLGLDWDGPVVAQSDRGDRYALALKRLKDLGRVYPCTCSRKEIRAASAPHGAQDEAPRYPGTCRSGPRPRPGRSPAFRFRTEPEDIVHHRDRRLGDLDQDVHTVVGDFVVRRSDGLWAYQLAVTVDDLEQGITCVVRGDDLAGSTARQLLLRTTLDPTATPLETMHVPLLRGPDGRRLAKRDGSASVAEARESGERAETIIGRLAASLGLIERAEPCRPEELRAAFRAALSSPEGASLFHEGRETLPELLDHGARTPVAHDLAVDPHDR